MPLGQKRSDFNEGMYYDGWFWGIINFKSGWESKKTSASSVTNKLVEDIHCEA